MIYTHKKYKKKLKDLINYPHNKNILVTINIQCSLDLEIYNYITRIIVNASDNLGNIGSCINNFHLNMNMVYTS